MTRPVAAPLHVADPGGLMAVWREAADGTRIRLAHMACANARGTVLLLHGRSEFIEKYQPVITRLNAMRLNVCTFDWRGQGLSDRLLDDPLPGYIRNFADYQQDIDTGLTLLREMFGPRPPLVIAHSMGGCIALQRLLAQPEAFSAAVLSAPMLGIRMPTALQAIAPLVARAHVRLGHGAGYLHGCDGRTIVDWPFEDNVLTRDPEMYERYVALVRATPALGLGGATWQWLMSAFSAMQSLVRAPEGALKPPVMIGFCGADTVVSNAAIASFAERQPAVTLLELAEARHEAFFETPETREAFWSGIEDFIAEQLTGAGDGIA